MHCSSSNSLTRSAVDWYTAFFFFFFINLLCAIGLMDIEYQSYLKSSLSQYTTELIVNNHIWERVITANASLLTRYQGFTEYCTQTNLIWSPIRFWFTNDFQPWTLSNIPGNSPGQTVHPYVYPYAYSGKSLMRRMITRNPVHQKHSVLRTNSYHGQKTITTSLTKRGNSGWIVYILLLCKIGSTG